MFYILINHNILYDMSSFIFTLVKLKFDIRRILLPAIFDF